MTQTLGTPYYMSPEVVRGKYDKRCDLWSIGVLTFYLISGRFPFNGKYKVLREKICTTDYDFNEKQWSTVSNKAKQFI